MEYTNLSVVCGGRSPVVRPWRPKAGIRVVKAAGMAVCAMKRYKCKPNGPVCVCQGVVVEGKAVRMCEGR